MHDVVPFVERESERQLYLEFLTQDSPWVLLASGLGGSGKSELLYDLDKHTPDNACVALLNFAPETMRTDGLKVLDQIASRIASQCDPQRFTTFKKRLDEGRRELANNSKYIIQQLAVGANAVAKENQLNLNLADPVRERRHLVWDRVTEALYNQVDTFKLDQLVLMVDHCEWISDQESGTTQSLDLGQWLFDELIPGLRSRMQNLGESKGRGKRLSVVIASSIPPELQISRSSDRRTYDWGQLDKTGADRYLEQIGILDADLRGYVYEDVTHGNALCIWIMGELYQELARKQAQAQKKQPLAFADRAELRTLFNEQALRLFVRPHIMDKYTKTSYVRDLIHYGVLLRSFDQPLLEAVFTEWFPTTEAFERFHKLIGYPYIERLGNSRYTFIALLREIATEYVREFEHSRWSFFHQQALKYLLVERRADWYFHNLAYNVEQGIRDWKQAVEQIDIHVTSTNPYHEELVEAIYDTALKLPLTACAERAYQRGRFNVRNERWEAAHEYYAQALKYYQELHDAPGEHTTEQAIAEVKQRQSNNGPFDKAG